MTATLEAPYKTSIITRLCDISHFQALVTLAFLKANNIKGVAAKCTEGDYYVDAHYATNHARVRSYGMPFWAYHFMRPESSSGTAAADYFLGHAKLKAGDRILLDAEASGLGQAATNQHIIDFAKRIIARSPLTGRDIYLSGGYCGNGTGKGVASYYEHIWYPAYHATGWPSSWSPGFASSWQANTGFHDGPHVWQCDTTGGFDHDVSWLTPAQLAGAAAPTPVVVEEDVAGYVSLSLAKPQPLTAKKSIHLHWTKENSDKAKQHAKNGPGILCHADTAGVWSADVTIGGLKGTWQFVQVDPKTGKESHVYASKDADGGVVNDVVNGVLGDGLHLYLKLNPTEDCTVEHASIRCLYWKAA